MAFKAGFISILGKPNAGKSSLLNALIGEKMAITSSKVQTTRHRIKAFLNTADYQLVFSDTPGIIEPKYRLHHKMMGYVKAAIEDADLALLLYDLTENAVAQAHDLFASLDLKVPAILVCNKSDAVSKQTVEAAVEQFARLGIYEKIITVSALQKSGLEELLEEILRHIPESQPYFSPEDLSDLPVKFFVSEIIREKVFELFHQEIPYHTAVVIQEFKEKETLIKIRADIVVQRETQKLILIGEKGSMIKKLGTEARREIEQFVDSKVFLELFVKVRPKWRDRDMYLKEYGYD